MFEKLDDTQYNTQYTIFTTVEKSINIKYKNRFGTPFYCVFLCFSDEPTEKKSNNNVTFCSGILFYSILFFAIWDV